MSVVDCFFRIVKKLIDEILKIIKNIIVDFYVEVIFEKIVLGKYLDGDILFFYGIYIYV